MRLSRANLLYNTALIGAVFIVCLDRIAKTIALQVWRFEPIIITDWLRLAFARNRFISFSLNLGFDPRWIILPIVIMLIAGIVFYIQKKHVPEAFALSCVCLGAASNAYDRFAYGFVIDYIDVHLFTVLNLADVMITIGVLAFALLSFRKQQQ